MEEVRKEIPWLPECKYYVSNLGRVKNKKGKIMKVEKNKYGHNRIKLYGPGGKCDVRHYQVHRLVYCVFNNIDYNYGLSNKISECIGLVCHKDNNPDNNALNNLYMDTQKKNMQQCIKDGRFVFLKPRYGKENNMYKPRLHVSRKTSGEFGETPNRTIPSQAT